MGKPISVKTYLPEVGVPVLVYFDDPEIEPEIDYLEIEVDYGTEYFANCGDEVKYWHHIAKHPKSK